MHFNWLVIRIIMEKEGLQRKRLIKPPDSLKHALDGFKEGTKISVNHCEYQCTATMSLVLTWKGLICCKQNICNVLTNTILTSVKSHKSGHLVFLLPLITL